MSIRIEAGPLRSGLVALAAAGLLGLFWVVAAAWKVEPAERILTRVDDRGVEVAGYLATYLVPFLTVSPSWAVNSSRRWKSRCSASTIAAT